MSTLPCGAEAELRRRIEREIARHGRSDPLAALGLPRLTTYLNNFHCRLPGGFYRTMYEGEELHEPYSDPRASRKLRAMTPAGFFALVDRLIAEVGLDVAEILRLQSARTGRIYDYAFPLYVRLRQEGFNHYPDLTS